MLRNSVRLNVSSIFKRNLSIHEYRSTQLLNNYKISHPRGSIAFSPTEASKIAHDLNVGTVVLKAQALTGGRGKGHFLESGLQGGVKMVKSTDTVEIESLTSKMLGNHLVTKQSGPKGKFVSGVFVVEKIDSLKESYLSIILDRSTRTPVIVCSNEGGVNIEETAAKNPKAIKKIHVDPLKGLTDIQANKIAKALGFSEGTTEETAYTVKQLYKIFMERDATQVEINPLSEIPNNHIMCMDAKFGFDDNASFRQEEIFSWRDLTQEDPDEVKAKKYDLNFVKLQGNIGCLVNGAGLAMATMDVIKLNGGDPANFLDCGGGATPETIKKAFELILSNEKVDAIFVNIFGGIVRCDHVAMGLVNAAKELGVKVPIVARLQGTKLAEGKEIIAKSGIHIHSFAELDPAAKKVVELAHS